MLAHPAAIEGSGPEGAGGCSDVENPLGCDLGASTPISGGAEDWHWHGEEGGAAAVNCEQGVASVMFHREGRLGIRLRATPAGPALRWALASALRPYLGWVLVRVGGKAVNNLSFGAAVRMAADATERPLSMAFVAPPQLPSWSAPDSTAMYAAVEVPLGRTHSFAIQSAGVQQDVQQLLSRSQLADLTDSFGLLARPWVKLPAAAGAGPAHGPTAGAGAPRTLGLLELRAVLRALGCERLCQETLAELTSLQRHLRTRAPASPHRCEPEPEPGPEPEPEPEPEEAAVRVNFSGPRSAFAMDRDLPQGLCAGRFSRSPWFALFAQTLRRVSARSHTLGGDRGGGDGVSMADMSSSALPLAEPYVAVPLCREDTKMGKYFYQVVWQDRRAGAPQIESWRRYSEFRKLRGALQQLLGPEVGSLPFPPKRVLRGSAAEVVAERRDALQTFLRALLVEQRLAVPAPPAAPNGEAETEAEPEASTAANLLWEFFSPPKVRCRPPPPPP
jgi:hypothetical protein